MCDRVDDLGHKKYSVFMHACSTVIAADDTENYNTLLVGLCLQQQQHHAMTVTKCCRVLRKRIT